MKQVYIFFMIISFIFFFIMDNRILLETLIVIEYISLILIFYKENNKKIIMLLFLLSFGIFNISKLILDILCESSWVTGVFFKEYYFDEKIVKKILEILYFHILGIIIGVLFYKENNKKSKFQIEQNKIILRVTNIVMSVCIIPAIVRQYLELKIVKSLGYLSLYNGELQNISFPFWTKGVNAIFTYSYYIYITGIPTKKNYIKFSFIFIGLKLLSALKGGRMEFVLNIFLVFSYYIIIYNKEIKIKILSYGVLVIIFSQLVSYMRAEVIDRKLLILDIFKDFFSEQGNSLLVLGINLIKKDEFIKMKFTQIFAPIIEGILRIRNFEVFKFQSEKLIEISNNLNFHLSYLYIKDYYLQGMGIGNNYLAEIYNFGGLIAIIIFGIFIGYFFLKFEDIIKKKRSFLYFGIPIILNIYISPRASFFPNLFNIYPYIIFYTFYQIIYIILKNLKRRKSSELLL